MCLREEETLVRGMRAAALPSVCVNTARVGKRLGLRDLWTSWARRWHPSSGHLQGLIRSRVEIAQWVEGGAEIPPLDSLQKLDCPALQLGPVRKREPGKMGQVCRQGER